jgi:DnaJ-class molecular chaperone
VKIHVQIPTNLTARQKELLEELAKEEQHHAAEDKKSTWAGTMHKAWERLRSFVGTSGTASEKGDKEDGEAGQQKASAK